MSTYTKEHYEDVARLLEGNTLISSPHDINKPNLVCAFANLFAADNPPTCIDCGSRPGEADPEDECSGHCFSGGFNRKQFLAACGLEAKPTETHLPGGILGREY